MKTFKNCFPAVLTAAVLLLTIAFFHSCKKNLITETKTSNLRPNSGFTARTMLSLPNTIGQGLIAYWSFAKTAYDLSGNGNTGTLHSVSSGTDRSNHTSGAYSFNGTTSYIVVPHNIALNLSGTDFTVNAWIKLNSYNAAYVSSIMNKRIGGNNNGWAWSVTGDTSVVRHVQSFGPGGLYNNGYGTDTISLSHWHMVTTIYSLANHSLRFYLDNVLDDTVGSIASPSALDTAMLYIGKINPLVNSNGYFFHGLMSDIRMYDRAITSSELTTLYTVPTAPTSGLLAFWPLTKTPNDLSGNGHNGTNHGPYAGTDRFGNSIGASHFNGSTAYIEADTAGLTLNNTDFTVNAWVKLISYNTTYGSAIMNRHLLGNNNGWAWTITGDTSSVTNHVQYFGPGGLYNNSYATTVISLNSWHMVTCTYTLSTHTITFYVDGVYDSAVTGIASPNAYTQTQLYIGKDNPLASSNGYFFNGLMNDLRIYNRAVSTTEITQLLNALD